MTPGSKYAMTLWTQKTSDEIVQILGELYDERLDLENATVHAVATARRLGLSWEQIAVELNVSRQAAWEKWRHVDAQA